MDKDAKKLSSPISSIAGMPIGLALKAIKKQMPDKKFEFKTFLSLLVSAILTPLSYIDRWRYNKLKRQWEKWKTLFLF